MRWTKEHLAEYMAKINPREEAQDTPDPGRESYLQSSCIRYCKDHGWPVFHDWSRKRNTAGWPDLFIFMDGRVVLVELKAAGGRLSNDQKTLRNMLKWQGHEVYVVRSFKRFVEVVS